MPAPNPARSPKRDLASDLDIHIKLSPLEAAVLASILDNVSEKKPIRPNTVTIGFSRALRDTIQSQLHIVH